MLWDNTKHPLIVRRSIEAKKIAKYLGLYYADGGKSSHYSCICSTKDITKIMSLGYHNIIANPKYTSSICYRKFYHEDNKIIEKRIKSYWRDIHKDISVNIHGLKLTNLWSNEYGEYRMDDSRSLALKIHLWLTEELLKKGNINKSLLEDFFMGGALGDGGVSNRRKEAFQHILISSNKQEYHVWENICINLKIPYQIKVVPNRNSAYIIISNYYVVYDLLTKGLFKEYTKRRIKLIAGLKNRIETKFIEKGRIYRRNKGLYREDINLKLLEVD